MRITVVPILEDDFAHWIIRKIFSLFQIVMFFRYYVYLFQHIDFFFFTLRQTLLSGNEDNGKPDPVWVNPIKLKIFRMEMAGTQSGEP